jgi:secretory carrier-associated membrane protein
MTTLAFSIGKNALNDTVDSIKNKFTNNKQDKPKVNWEDFNWPPFLKVVHFSLDELEDYPIQPFIRNMFLSHLVVFLLSIINLINTII